MKRFHANIGSRDAALQETPKILKPVRVHAAIYVLCGVVNDLMRVIRCQSIVGHERIAVKRSASGYMLAYFLLQYSLTTAGNNGSTNLSAALQDAHDGGLVLRPGASDPALALTQVHVACLTADESFIYLNFAAKFGTEEIVLHRKANPLQHEPSRFLGNSHVLGNLVATDTVLAVSEHPSCGEPFIQRNRAVLVDRADFDGELTLGVMATTLPSTTLGIELADLFGTATGANDLAVWPSADSDVVNAVIGIREVNNRFLKALRFLVHLRSSLTKIYQKTMGESSIFVP